MFGGDILILHLGSQFKGIIKDLIQLGRNIYLRGPGYPREFSQYIIYPLNDFLGINF